MNWRNIALTAAVVGSLAVPTTTADAATGGSAIQRFTPLYMAGGTLTLAQALVIAKDYNFVAEQSNALSAYVSQMHAANPKLKLIVYVNGSYDTSPNGTTYPSSWYAHDAAGQKIYSTQFHNWLMLPVPSWNSEVGTLCTQALKASGYDGCFLDSLGEAPFDAGYVNSPPIDPSTGKVFTPQKWIADEANTVTATQKANPGKIVVANGLGNGQKFPITQPLLTAVGTGMSELWLRVNNWPVDRFPPLADWLQDVDMLITAGSKHEVILTVTKLWVHASTAQQNQWHAFTEASFLLGTDGNSAYCFTTSQTASGLSVDTPYDHVAIGTPTGAMSSAGTLYKRTFTNGIVLVNPGTKAATFQLGGMYVNLAGKPVSSETLAPDTADIFVK
jgi:Hypothetical glycosyl hydrolase family 15